MSLVAEIVAVGDELAHGHAVDTNSGHIARELEDIGFAVHRHHVVSDDLDALTAVIGDACGRADVVVTTGGLGPTLDDRTRDAVAAAAGLPLRFDAAAWQRIRAHFRKIGRTEVPASNRRQAEFPAGADVLDNARGTAPGFAVAVGRALLLALPGVPREMRAMLGEQVVPRLRVRLAPAAPLVHRFRVLRVLGPSEAALGERLAEFMVAGREPRVGITASSGLLSVRIAAAGADAAAAAAAAAATADRILPLLGADFVCDDDRSLAEVAVARLRERGLSLATAESCTGGMIASALTDVPGASAVFRGGVVSYADAVKADLLEVPPALLAAAGAVAESVAGAMARGVAARLGSDLGLAVTGVAGPDGGTADKPVGTVCFGWWCEREVSTWTRRFAALGRGFVRGRTVMEALATIVRRLAE